MSLEEAAKQREEDYESYEASVLDSMQVHVEAMLELQRRGAVTFDYGNNLRGQVADRRGMTEAFEIPGFVPEYIRPLFCKGAGPFRWAALSGNPEDIYATDKAYWKRSRKTSHSSDGSRRQGRRYTSRDCRLESAGWNTETAPRWA